MLFKKRRCPPDRDAVLRLRTEQWYIDEGKDVLDERLFHLRDCGLKQVWLTNLDLLPQGTTYKDLDPLLGWEHRFVRDQNGDDILVFFE